MCVCVKERNTERGVNVLDRERECVCVCFCAPKVEGESEYV